jgi:hypothetical protein
MNKTKTVPRLVQFLLLGLETGRKETDRQELIIEMPTFPLSKNIL